MNNQRTATQCPECKNIWRVTNMIFLSCPPRVITTINDIQKEGYNNFNLKSALCDRCWDFKHSKKLRDNFKSIIEKEFNEKNI